MTTTRTASTTAQALATGSKVHHANPGRFGGAVLACNGRTLSLALPGAGAVDCSACRKAVATGRVLLLDNDNR